jgi:hypothetical protein
MLKHFINTFIFLAFLFSSLPAHASNFFKWTTEHRITVSYKISDTKVNTIDNVMFISTHYGPSYGKTGEVKQRDYFAEFEYVNEKSEVITYYIPMKSIVEIISRPNK